MIKKLNDQINLEMYSSNLYLQMSSWCAYKGLEGCSSFLSQHAEEELLHGKKLLNYIDETGGLAILGAIPAPPQSFQSLREVFEKIFEHEKMITKKINELVNVANAESDYATLQFLQWYVAEQHEEEFLFKTILDKINIIGTEGQGVFFIDREIGEIMTRRSAKKAVTNPSGQPA